ncbi:polysaccharide pyruvyl transferase CsaB [bacterium]|nr:polysaccharide pyruvyl transferase CsaB [bacterium]
MSKRIVISGYYGFGNTGDEAVLDGMLAAFRNLGLDVEITVLSADPTRTIAEHPGVISMHRYSPGAVINAIRRADLVISGGGSLIQDVTSARSAQYYLYVLRLAQFLRRPTMVYAQGIGPLDRPNIRRYAARILNKTKLITVRDSDSRTLLESMGVSIPPVHVTSDPSFLVEPDLEAANDLLDKHGLQSRALMGVSLRPWITNDWLHAAIDGISSACEELDVTAVVIPMQESEDMEVGTKLSKGVMVGCGGNPRTIKAVIAGCGLMVGMRLHSLIFAADVGVACVPIAYDPKITAFASSIGRGPGMDVNSPDAGKLRDAIVTAWHEREALGVSVGEHAKHMREMALESGKMAAGLLEQ